MKAPRHLEDWQSWERPMDQFVISLAESFFHLNFKLYLFSNKASSPWRYLSVVTDVHPQISILVYRFKASKQRMKEKKKRIWERREHGRCVRFELTGGWAQGYRPTAKKGRWERSSKVIFHLNIYFQLVSFLFFQSNWYMYTEDIF